ncbi:hypothetical protein TWF696_004831 [Orbilia brochopaga]|uniref:F-box domain-containing protein n=1 Tax=Orbilia brochopaga TaxID=3140254 RepID=A0AAV9V5F9_9PEZI
MSALSALPFEILFEITSYLDKRALKAVRTAAPNSSLYHAASTDLFRSLALRLCTPLWTSRHIRAKLWHLDNIGRGVGHARRLFGVGPQVIRELVVDTRYPYNLSNRPPDAPNWCRGQHPVMNTGFLPFDTNDMPDEDIELFIELVRRVVGLATDLVTVRWRGSNRLSVSAYTALARVLCAPERTYRLNASLRWDSPVGELGDYMASLADLSALGLEFAAWNVGAPNCRMFSKQQAQAVIAVIHRSPDLQGFKFHLHDGFSMAEVTTSMLWSAVFDAPALNTFALEHTWKNMPPIQFPATPRQLDKLRNITLVAAMTGSAAANVVEKSVRSLHIAAVRPRTFKTNVFSRLIANFLLTDRTNHLTSLDVECHEYLGPVSIAQLGAMFWNEVVMRHAGSLRVIRGYSRYSGDWAWLDTPNNPAKRVLDKCTALEELTVTCVETQQGASYITEMLEHLLLRTPRLGVVNVAFPVRTAYHVLEQTVARLDAWSSSDARYHGRQMQVRYRTRDDWEVSMVCSLRGRHGPGGAPVLFDDKIQAWELRERREKGLTLEETHGPGPITGPISMFERTLEEVFEPGPVMVFERVNDSYIFDDGNI